MRINYKSQGVEIRLGLVLYLFLPQGYVYDKYYICMTNHTQESLLKKDQPNARKGKYFVKLQGRVREDVLCLTPLTHNLWWGGSGSIARSTGTACRRSTTITMRKTITTRARVSARGGPLQPLRDGARRQQRDRTYGTVGESIGEGLPVVN
jgi:hypothetical protein